MEFDFIIVGSGLGGLVSGIILAKEGYSVCILEKNHQAGGNLQAFTRNGHSFSTGLHYIGSMEEGQILHRLFNYLGISGKLDLKKMDPEGFDRIVFGDESTEYRLAMGWERFGASLAEQFPGEQAAIMNYTGAVRESIASIPMYNLETAATPGMDIDTLGKCTMGFLSRLTSNKRLTGVLAGANSVYHHAASRTPFYVHSCIRNSFVGSAWKIKGGSGHLAEALVAELTSLGATLLTDCDVTGFSVAGNRIESVILSDGRRFTAKRFISNLHPAATLNLGGTDLFPKAFRNRVLGLENTAGFFTLYLIFKENTFPYLDYNLFWYRNDEYCSGKPFSGAWPQTFMIYTPYHEAGQKYSRTASVLSFMDTGECMQWTSLPPEQRGNSYEEFKKQRAAMLLDALELRFPGIRNQIESHFVSTPATFRDYTGSPDGSGYGILKDCNDPLRSIVSPKTRIPNLSFTGQNLNIHGVLGTTISAFVTCSETIGFKNLIHKVIHA